MRCFATESLTAVLGNAASCDVGLLLGTVMAAVVDAVLGVKEDT